MGAKIDLVKADNWEGLYVNDKLVLQDHTISAIAVLRAVNHEIVECSEVIEAELEWMDKLGSLPKNLEDVIRVGENDPEHKDFVYSPITD